MTQFLTTVEKAEFFELEGRIEKGLKTFVEVGDALMAIRDKRLYRQSHGTFEDYCRERWGMERNYANKLIAASGVVSNLGTIVPILPTSESQARPLTRLEPEEQREAWQVAVASAGNGRVTARHVEEAARRVAYERMDDGWDDYEEEPAIEYEPAPERLISSNNGRSMAVHYSSETDEWATPQDLFDLLDSEFSFDLDVCALPENAKCPAYFTPEDNGLAQDWRGVCWMNPPYGDEIKKWIGKAHQSAKKGCTVVCLVPARVDTGWWWDYCIQGEVRFLRGRLKFGGGDGNAPFPSALIIFRPGVSPAESKVIWWTRG
jgi:phage N-6-adenine-methyltransferase